MSNRYKICFEFDGLNFFGSQKQPDKRTVQQELENSIRTLIKEDISIIPSGRTDAKVSAKYQTAHFDSVQKIDDLDKCRYKLNCILPEDLKILSIECINPHFHAQKSAKYKHYRYTIQNDHVASVFSLHSLFYPYFELDVDKINKMLSYLVGHHDFSAFKSASDNPYNDCIIYFAQAHRETIERHDFIFVDIVGNRFLYNMIRTIIGEILYILRNNLDPKLMDDILKSKDRTKAKDVIDAKGLCLEYVGYDEPTNYVKNLFKERQTNEDIQCKTS